MSAYAPKILIIDDFSENLKLLGNSLKKENFSILTALSGKQGLALVESKKPDLILLDVMMPEMDGFEVCERLKNNVATVDIPIIFVTALNQLENIKSGLEIGAADFVTKPFKINELLVKINHQLRISRKEKFNAKLLDIIKLMADGTIHENAKRFLTYENSSIIDANKLIHPTSLDFIFKNINYFDLENSLFSIADLQAYFINKYNLELVFADQTKYLEMNKFSGFTFLKFILDLIWSYIQEEVLKTSKSEVYLEPITFDSDLLKIELSLTEVNLSQNNFLAQIVNEKDIRDANIVFLKKLFKILDFKLELSKSVSNSKLKFECVIHKKIRSNKDIKLEIKETENINLPKVLVVEDNQLNIEYLAALLQEQKLEFDLAYSGYEAIEKLKSEAYQIIFMDVHLPDITGIEVTKILRNKFQYSGSIISISGSIDEETIMTCRQCGFNDFLTKPFSAMDFDKIVKQYLPSIGDSIKDNLNFKNEVATNYSYAKALEIANGDAQLLKTWLFNFCNVLNKALETSVDLKSKLVYKGGEKVLHDLLNYAGYFQIDEIISIVQELKSLKEQDQDYKLQLKALLNMLESEVRLANTYYQNALKEVY